MLLNMSSMQINIFCANALLVKNIESLVSRSVQRMKELEGLLEEDEDEEILMTEVGTCNRTRFGFDDFDFSHFEY